jgi:NhaA family Na+:H+ antiporter
MKVARIWRGFEHFSEAEASGGIVLIIATTIAMIWANSPWSESYHELWKTTFSVGVPAFGLSLSLHDWINDGLMVVFFFVVGLEIKREILDGELSSLRQATLPIAAAAGGMVVPALLFAAVNSGGTGSSGWGIPMATDIAFALGVLALLGSRIPLGLKVFLTALAIVDDLGAVMIIALFYTADLQWLSLIGGVLLLLLLFALNKGGVRQPALYVAIGVIVWLCFLHSGVHATIAGVLLALTVPASTKIDDKGFVASALNTIKLFERSTENEKVLGNSERLEAIYAMEDACEAALPPLVRIEDKLHEVVAFAVVPLFALANAGLDLRGLSVPSLTHDVTLGVVIGLFLGKPAGIMIASWLAIRSGRADLPARVSWSMLNGAAWLAGIGFTMSLFIATLAFGDSALLENAKLGVLAASAMAGAAGAIFLIRSISRQEKEAT